MDSHCLVAAFLALGSGYGLVRLARLKRSLRHWVEVPGQVKEYRRLNVRSIGIEHDRDPLGRDTSFLALYRYGGREYTTGKLSPLDCIIPFWGKASEHAHAKIVAAMRDGGVVQLWMNPDRPEQAMVDMRVKRSWFVYFALIFLFSTVACVLFTLISRHA